MINVTDTNDSCNDGTVDGCCIHVYVTQNHVHPFYVPWLFWGGRNCLCHIFHGTILSSQ